jgi:hypothetical protein
VRYAFGLGLAVSLGAGSAALAQERQPTRRIPVTKEQPPAPDTTQVAPADTAPPAPAPQPEPPPPPPPEPAPAPVDTTPPPMPPMPEPLGARSWWYIGLAGGPTLPLGDVDDFFDLGWNARVPIGWQSLDSPWGIRLDLGYDNLPVDEEAAGDVDASDFKAFSATANLNVRLPWGESRRSAFYLIGGPGLYYLQDFPDDNGEIDNRMKFGANGGAGLEFGFGRRAAFFVEGRYHWISDGLEEFNTTILPITIGFKF